MLSEAQRKSRSKLARAHRDARRRNSSPDDDPAVVAATVDYKVVSAEEYIRRLVEEAPPLTDEKRDWLASILRGGSSDA
jgi:hypothetical protein